MMERAGRSVGTDGDVPGPCCSVVGTEWQCARVRARRGAPTWHPLVFQTTTKGARRAAAPRRDLERSRAPASRSPRCPFPARSAGPSASSPPVRLPARLRGRLPGDLAPRPSSFSPSLTAPFPAQLSAGATCSKPRPPRSRRAREAGRGEPSRAGETPPRGRSPDRAQDGADDERRQSAHPAPPANAVRALAPRTNHHPPSFGRLGRFTGGAPDAPETTRTPARARGVRLRRLHGRKRAHAPAAPASAAPPRRAMDPPVARRMFSPRAAAAKRRRGGRRRRKRRGAFEAPPRRRRARRRGAPPRRLAPPSLADPPSRARQGGHRPFRIGGPAREGPHTPDPPSKNPPRKPPARLPDPGPPPLDPRRPELGPTRPAEDVGLRGGGGGGSSGRQRHREPRPTPSLSAPAAEGAGFTNLGTRVTSTPSSRRSAASSASPTTRRRRRRRVLFGGGRGPPPQRRPERRRTPSRRRRHAKPRSRRAGGRGVREGRRLGGARRGGIPRGEARRAAATRLAGAAQPTRTSSQRIPRRARGGAER